MAFPIGWKRKCKLSIDPTYIDGNLSGFPVLANALNLPTEMFSLDGPFGAKPDGSDIRFTSDQAGLNQLPVEVVGFNLNVVPALGTAEVWVKVPTVSSSLFTDIWVWYANPDATLPAAGSDFGSESVWDSDYEIVLHLGDSVDDSTSNGLTGTNNGTTVDTGVTQFGVSSRRGDYPGQTDYITYGNVVDINGQVPITFEALTRFNSFGADYQGIFTKGDTQYHLQKNNTATDRSVQAVINDGVTWNSSAGPETLVVDTWYYFTGHYDGSAGGNLNVWYDTTKYVGDTTSNINSTSFALACFYNSQANRGMDGWLEECRISSVDRGDDWIKATVSTAKSPGSFMITGVPQSAQSGALFFGSNL